MTVARQSDHPTEELKELRSRWAPIRAAYESLVTYQVLWADSIESGTPTYLGPLCGALAKMTEVIAGQYDFKLPSLPCTVGGEP